MTGRWGLAAQSAIAACVVGACLPDPVPLAGDRIVPGRDVSGPIALRASDSSLVVFRRTVGDDRRSLQVVPVQGGQPRTLVENASASGQLGVDQAGVLYAVLSKSPDVAAAGQDVVRVDAVSGQQLDRFDGVTAVKLARDRALVSWAAPDKGFTFVGPGIARRTLDSAQLELAPTGRLYFVSPVAGTGLARMDGAAAPTELLPGLAERFWLAPDETRAIVTGSAVADPVTREIVRLTAVVDLGAEPVMRPLLLGDRRLNRVTIGPGGQHAIASTRAPVSPDGVLRSQLTIIELGSGRVHELDGDAPPWTEVAWRPDGASVVLSENHSNVPPTLIDLATRTWRRAGLRRRALEGQFSPDGRWYVFVGLGGDGAPDRGLYVVDAGFSAEARLVSPAEGSVVGYFFLDGGRVGYVMGRGLPRPELQVVALDDAISQPLARDLGSVVVGGARILAVIDQSDQDRSGSLVLFDTSTGLRRQLAVAVTDFSAAAPCDGCPLLAPGAQAAYVVRGRAATDRDGLWVASLP